MKSVHTVRCHKDFEKQRGEMKYWNEGLGEKC